MFLSSLSFSVKMTYQKQTYCKRKAAESEGPVARKQITNPEIIIPELRTLTGQKLKWS